MSETADDEHCAELLEETYPDSSLNVADWEDCWEFRCYQPFRFTACWDGESDPRTLTLDIDLSSVSESELHRILELMKMVDPDNLTLGSRAKIGAEWVIGYCDFSSASASFTCFTASGFNETPTFTAQLKKSETMMKVVMGGDGETVEH